LRLLLDTHAVIWWFQGNLRMTRTAREAVARDDTAVFVSAVSAFEISLKHWLGKLPEASPLVADFSAMLAEQGFESLALTADHAIRAGGLSIAHRDPFDRLLIAQALVEDLTLVSNERLFDAMGVARIW
jgi:PIN domain nuclease of toxin-antitoxin system